MKGTTVYLTDEERRFLNILAGENGGSLNDLMAEAIRTVYAEEFNRLRDLFARGVLRSSKEISNKAKERKAG